MWNEDFKFSKCSLNHDAPEEFTKCFWQKEQKVVVPWLAYRVILSLYFIISSILTIMNVGRDIKKEDATKYYIFLTNWTYSVQTIQYFYAMLIVLKKFINEKNERHESKNKDMKMICSYKFYWSLQTITVSASITVTCIFWAAVYDPQYNPLDFINFTTHVFNSIFTIIDFILVGHPFRIAHIYLPVIYSGIYLIFSLIYQLSGGTGTESKIPIYEILDWRKPGPTILTCVFAQLLLLIVHILFWLCYKAKVAIRKRISNSCGNRKQKEGIENLGMDMGIV